MLRMLLNAGEKIANLAQEHNGRDLSEVLAKPRSMLSEVIFGNIADDIEVHDGVSIMREVCNTFERAMQTKGLIGVSTGLSDLDAHQRHEAGRDDHHRRTSFDGQDSICHQPVPERAPQGQKPVVVFSMEMPARTSPAG